MPWPPPAWRSGGRRRAVERNIPPLNACSYFVASHQHPIIEARRPAVEERLKTIRDDGVAVL